MQSRLSELVYKTTTAIQSQIPWKNTLLILVCIYSFLMFLLWDAQAIFSLKQTAVLRLIRGSLFFVIVSSIVQIIFNCKKLQPQILFAALPSILMIVLYSIPLTHTNQLPYLGQFYTFAPLLFLALLIDLKAISTLSVLRIPSIMLLSIIYFLAIFLPLFYIGYYYIYHDVFDLFALVAILNTNINEARAYLLQFMSPVFIAGLFSLFLVIFLSVTFVTYKLTLSKHLFILSHTLPKKFLTIFLLVFLFLFGHHLMKVFPFDMYDGLTQNGGLLSAFTELHDNIDKNSKQLMFNKASLSGLASRKAPGSIVLVIGESANRDYMSAFNTALNVTTTPWEDRCSRQKDFTFMQNSYANFPNTIMALTQALTSVNQYNNTCLKEGVSLLDLAKKAGYHTYWISMQEKGSIYDAGITVVAERADKCIWSKGHYDEEILKELRTLQLPSTENHFIILHLMGSHNRYPERVPASFLETHSLPKEIPYPKYTPSLLYTDYVLQEIFEYAQKNLNLQSMIYFSDHGEDMKYMHTASPFYFSMVRIPFWIYLSPKYQKEYPEILPNLKNHSQSVFTNDLIFDTVSGLLHADTNFYHPEYDITNKKYSITRENAKTLHGKRNISEEKVAN